MSSIPPFMGLWVQALKANAAVRFVAGSSNFPDVPPVTTENAWYLSMKAESNGGVDFGMNLGVHPLASDGYDTRDTMRMAGNLLPEVSVPHSDWGSQAGNYIMDTRKTVLNQGEQVVWNLTVKGEQGKEVTISALNLGDLPTAAWIYQIEDPDTGGGVTLSVANPSYTYIQGAAAKTLVLRATRSIAFVGSLGVTLGSNSPMGGNVAQNEVGVVMVQVKAEAQLEGIFVNKITVKAEGTADDVALVGGVRLYRDTNGDGQPDTLMAGPSTFSADDGTIEFSGLSELINGGEHVYWVVVYDIGGQGSGTLRVKIVPNQIQATGELSGASIWGSGPDIEGAEKTLLAPVPVAATEGNGSCGLLGIEVLLLMGLAKMRRRFRRE
jgi:hypothetical protein